MERLAFSIGEVSEALGTSRTSVWRWVHSGELPAVKVGGRLLIPAQALRRRLEAPSVTPNTTPDSGGQP